MLRLAYSLCLLASVALSTGCAMCCHPYDECYNCFGGIAPRCDQCCGRVASVFDPADGGVGEGYSEEVYEGAAPEMTPAPPAEPAMRPYLQSQGMRQPSRNSVLK